MDSKNPRTLIRNLEKKYPFCLVSLTWDRMYKEGRVEVNSKDNLTKKTVQLRIKAQKSGKLVFMKAKSLEIIPFREGIKSLL